MAYAEDPADVIRRGVTAPRGDGLIPIESIRIGGQDILVGVYVPTEKDKTVRGIIIPGNTREENKYQGITGLILKMGPLAFRTPKTEDWFVDADGNPNPPKVDDWVIFDVKTSHPLYLAGTYCRFVQAEYIYGVVATTDLVA